MKVINSAKNSTFSLVTRNGGIYRDRNILGQYNGGNDMRKAATEHLNSKEREKYIENVNRMWVANAPNKYERELREFYTETDHTWVTHDVEKILKKDRLKILSEMT